MKMALREALRGLGATSPNPRVGAVIVKEGREIARGYHRFFGALHAEADSLTHVSPDAARGATLYVNLEPCCHQGKTPPCTKVIIRAGIRRVVYGLRDPNPLVNGKGVEELRKAGVEVHGPILEEESREINRGYLKFRRSSRPWVTLKMAQSLDGRIASGSGDSRWISSPHSLKLAHRLRAQHDAVLVGINTVLSDDPELTVRLVRGNNPKRIVLDSRLRINPGAKVFHAKPHPVIIATRPYPPQEKAERLRDRGAEIVWLPPDADDKLDINVLLDELGQRGVLYLLVEGGSHVFSTFIRGSLFDEVIVVTAPKLIGGDGIPSIAPLGIDKVARAVDLRVVKRKVYGPDLAIWLRPKSK